MSLLRYKNYLYTTPNYKTFLYQKNACHSMKKLLLTLLVVLASCGKEEVAKPKSAAEQSRPIVNRDSENVLDAIADPHFLSWAEAQMDIWDKDGDGVLSQAEAAGVKKISLPVGGEIASLAGIEHFTGLTYLTCTENRLSSLDLSHNTSLETWTSTTL